MSEVLTPLDGELAPAVAVSAVRVVSCLDLTVVVSVVEDAPSQLQVSMAATCPAEALYAAVGRTVLGPHVRGSGR